MSKDNNTMITIEGKADESFGTLSFIDSLHNGIAIKKEKPTSNKLNRVIDLYSKTFFSNDKVLDIMYQLTHWFASSLHDAKNFESENIMMILFEFQSQTTKQKYLDRNHKEFEKFINFISEDHFTEISNEQILGPIQNKYTQSKNLYVGYYSIK
jgi:hypothetical protein